MENNRFTDFKELKTNQTWQNRAEESIAHGSLTNSKRPICLVNGVYPTHLARGQGCHVWDTDGKKYVDFICGLGSNLLGYANTEINQAMAEQANRGATLSLGTDLEVRTAEKVKELFPFIDKIRFLKTGSDACSAAVRIARAKTGRDLILSDGYHGWHDGFVSLTPPALGVPMPQAIHVLGAQDFSGVAGVIVEPIILDGSKDRIEWLKALRQKCDESGALLIFDEVITGFRFEKYCVSRFWGITPDLICLGKAMGNGMPISVVGGRAAVMDCGEWFVSSTFAGETLSLAAALKTMTLLQSGKYDIGHLWEKGWRFMTLFNAMWPDKLRIDGYATRGAFKGDELVKALFWQEMCRAGVIFGPSWFFNFPHIDVMDEVLSTSQDVLTRIKTGSVKLTGDMPTTPFAAKMRKL